VNPDLTPRARLWLRRELRVFDFVHDENTLSTYEHAADGTSRHKRVTADFLVEYIVAILRNIDTQGSSGQAEDMIRNISVVTTRDSFSTNLGLGSEVRIARSSNGIVRFSMAVAVLRADYRSRRTTPLPSWRVTMPVLTYKRQTSAGQGLA
jgi:hypothetical protein